MTNLTLPCDGCGQPAGAAHIARRLERLAWSTRFRPVHIQVLLLAGIAPAQDAEFLYAPGTLFHGEAAEILKAIALDTAGKPVEIILAEFQKMGLMLAHVLECPLEDGADGAALIEKQLPATLARVRRSLKPKKVALLSAELSPVGERIRAGLQAPVFPAGGGVFVRAMEGLREAIGTRSGE